MHPRANLQLNAYHRVSGTHTFARHLDEQDLMTLGSIAHKLLDRLRSEQLC